MARKITIKNNGVYVDEVKIPGVIGAEIKNINPGPSGPMEVLLTLRTTEVDVQYSLFRSTAKQGPVFPLQSP